MTLAREDSILPECPVCGADSMRPFFTRTDVPVHMHTLFREPGPAIEIERGTIRYACCLSCGFVSNLDFDLTKMRYDSTYDNSQLHSSTYLAYLDDLAERLVWEKNVRDCTVVEVGCGSGAFLTKLVESESSGNVGIGFDPAYQGPDTRLNGRLRFERRFYDGRAAATRADVVVCRHVIEHVPAPFELLSQIRTALVSSPEARLFFETPCFEWIIENEAYWDMCYEHCSFFSQNSLSVLFERAGFHVEAVNHVFGGQYLWIEASLSSERAPNRRLYDLSTAALRYAAREESFVKQIVAELGLFNGRVAVWGAGAKGVSFLNLVDPRRTLIDCVVDLNPQKQGGYIPGTGHPIVSYRELPAREVELALLMNPNYRLENMKLLESDNQRLPLSDLGSCLK